MATFNECGNLSVRSGVRLDEPSATNWNQPRSLDLCVLPSLLGTGAGLRWLNVAHGRSTTGDWWNKRCGGRGARRNNAFGGEPLANKGRKHQATAGS